MRGNGWLGLVAALVLCVVIALAASPAGAATKTLQGELQCAPNERITGIWMLGSQSGWHGFDYPADRAKQPTMGKYQITAVSGETIQHWIRCSVFGEFYGSFKVGRGSTRHICSPGWLCGSVDLGGCALGLVRSKGLSISVWGCLAKAVR